MRPKVDGVLIESVEAGSSVAFTAANGSVRFRNLEPVFRSRHCLTIIVSPPLWDTRVR